jgi:hypothetical protein
LFIFSPGKENLPPIMTTPRHSIDSSNEQALPGKKGNIYIIKKIFVGKFSVYLEKIISKKKLFLVIQLCSKSMGA